MPIDDDTALNPETAAWLRRFFHYWNNGILLKWRLGFGPWLSFWPAGFGRFVVVTHHGRKSGELYRTPLNYAEVYGDIYCVAGFGKYTDWYLNLLVNPRVELWLPNGWWRATAEEVPDDDERHLYLLRQVLRGSGVVAPLVGIDPVAMSDEELQEATRGYRLMRFLRTAERTGAGGPGDLAWVWPIIAVVLFLLWRAARRR